MGRVLSFKFLFFLFFFLLFVCLFVCLFVFGLFVCFRFCFVYYFCLLVGSVPANLVSESTSISFTEGDERAKLGEKRTLKYIRIFDLERDMNLLHYPKAVTRYSSEVNSNALNARSNK